jgi:hypothetical protein
MAVGALNPIEHPDAWNTFRIQGTDTPGKCEVKGFKRQVEWDIKIGKGTAGATETVKGLPPAKGAVSFWAWVPAHFAAWDALLPKLKFDPTKQTKQANEVYHPALADIDVSSVNIESIGQWEHEGGSLWRRDIEMLEFAPPPTASAVATPTGADAGSASVPGAPQDPATVALQKEAAALAKQAQQAYGSP